MSKQPQYRQFGAYRLALALSVLLSHTFILSLPADAFIRKMGIGNIGVMSFFVLSGFIMTEAAHSFYLRRPIAFIVNRFWRIAPPYWTALILSIAVHTLFGEQLIDGVYRQLPMSIFEPRNLIANALIIFPRPGRMDIATPDGFYGFVWFFWAILVEMKFYVVVCATLFAYRVTGRWIVPAMITVFISLHVVSDYIEPLRSELTFVPYFALGTLLYYSEQSIAARFGSAIAAALSIIHFSWYSASKPAHLTLEIATQPAILAVTLSFAISIAFMVALSKLDDDRFARIDRKLGELSYPIYLNQYAVFIAAANLTSEISFRVQIAAVVSTLVLSWVLAVVIERPLVPLRDRWRGRRLGQPPTASQSRPINEPVI